MKNPKLFRHFEDTPFDHWVTVSNTSGGLFGFRHEDGLSLTRELPAYGRPPFHEPFYLEEDFQSIVKFLEEKTGSIGLRGPVDEDGHPCFLHYKDAPFNQWVAISESEVGVFCYRHVDGLTVGSDSSFEVGSWYDPPKRPLFHYEELDELVRFLAGKEGVKFGKKGGTDE